MFLGKILAALLSNSTKQEAPAERYPNERRDQSPVGQGKRADFDFKDRVFKETWDKRRDDALRAIDHALNNLPRDASAFSIQRRADQLKQEVQRAHRTTNERDMRGAEDQIYIFKTQGR